jgi:hypothetical protein
MNLEEFINSLPENKQLHLALRLIKLTLPIWESYCQDRDISYRDSVVGLTHATNKELPRNVINAVEEYLSLNRWKRMFSGMKKLSRFRSLFLEPITALQDDDWKLPYEVQTMFYAVYNLLDAAMGKTVTSFGDSTAYVSINQAADALETSKTMTFEEINSLLQEYKNEEQ